MKYCHFYNGEESQSRHLGTKRWQRRYRHLPHQPGHLCLTLTQKWKRVSVTELSSGLSRPSEALQIILDILFCNGPDIAPFTDTVTPCLFLPFSVYLLYQGLNLGSCTYYLSDLFQSYILSSPFSFSFEIGF